MQDHRDGGKTLKSIISDVKRKTPRSFTGYYYLKTQKIFIPFKKITLECHTRRISELNLFFESILSLVNIAVGDVSEIARILGVDYSVVKEAVIDMVSSDYVFPSENTLIMTDKGAEALKSRKQVDIRKTYLTDLLVDMITGEVHGEDLKLVRPQNSDVSLEAVIDLDDSYFDSHFSQINRVYQQQQRDNSDFGESAVISELYKIIGIQHSELNYVEDAVSLYRSKTSSELLFDLQWDTNDRYKNELFKQLRETCRPCQENFFERSRDLVSQLKQSPITIRQDLMEQTEAVRIRLSKEDAVNEDLINEFSKKRYALFDREYMSYLDYPKDLGYKRLIVSSGHLTGLLTHSFCDQLIALSDNLPVFIIYNKTEYNVERSINYFFRKKKKTSANLHFVPSQTVPDNVICFDSELVIYLNEDVVSAFEKPVLYLLPICEFDKERAKALANCLSERYNLEELASTVSNRSKTSGKKD